MSEPEVGDELIGAWSWPIQRTQSLSHFWRSLVAWQVGAVSEFKPGKERVLVERGSLGGGVGAPAGGGGHPADPGGLSV